MYNNDTNFVNIAKLGIISRIAMLLSLLLSLLTAAITVAYHALNSPMFVNNGASSPLGYSGVVSCDDAMLAKLY
jgi:hypothetical protein